eukprot:33554_1
MVRGQNHGGYRGNNLGPTPTPSTRKKTRGLFKRKAKFSKPKKRSSAFRCNQMAKVSASHRKDKKIEKLTFDKANLEASMEKLQREKDDLYNKLGAYLDHNEIAKLKDKLCLLSDTKAMELIQLKMLLQNVYNCRMSIKQCHKNIFNAFKLVGDNDNESAIRRALYSQSKMNRVVRFNFNVLAHLLGALTVITLVPKKGLVLEHDGTERIKRNLMGVLLEWEITKNIDSKFKRMTKGGKTVSISDHIRNTKIKTLGNLVIGYKECDGKDSRSLFNFFRKLFDETDRFQNILNRPENRIILQKAFGDDIDLNFDPISGAIECTKTDRHSVVYHVIFFAFFRGSFFAKLV